MHKPVIALTSNHQIIPHLVKILIKSFIGNQRLSNKSLLTEDGCFIVSTIGFFKGNVLKWVSPGDKDIIIIIKTIK